MSLRFHPGLAAVLAAAAAGAQPTAVPITLGPPLPPVSSLRTAPVSASTLAEAVDACVANEMTRTHTPGAAVAVALDGGIAYQRGYGVKHRRNGGEVTATTRFRIGSITKMMTAAAVLQQVEAGTVSLLDPVTRQVPEFTIAPPYDSGSITVHNLLTHTSGFPDNFTQISGETDDGALARWAASQGSIELFAPPGTFWNYTNPGYMLAGLVAERAAGVPYRRYVTEHVWLAAGMGATTFAPAAAQASGDVSFGHLALPGGGEAIVAVDAYDNGWAAPAGYAFSTAPDLVRWALMLMDGGGTVLPTWASEVLQAPQVSLSYRPDQGYGYGVMSELYQGLDLRHHGGNINGWGAMLMWVPERRFAVAVLANRTEGMPQAAYCVVDAVLHPTGAPAPEEAPEPSLWPTLVGTYDLLVADGRRLEMELDLEGGQLWVTFRDGPADPQAYRTRLAPLWRRVFLLDSDDDGEVDTDITFLADAPAGRPRWARNRYFVGQRRFEPRRVLRAPP